MRLAGEPVGSEDRILESTGLSTTAASYHLIGVGSVHRETMGQHPLFEAERAVLGRRASSQRRTTFHLGRAAAHLAMADLGLDPSPVLRGDHGEPLWPRGVVGSITHAEGRALAAVGHSRDFAAIGIDLEPLIDFPDLAHQVACAEEIDWLVGLPRHQRQRVAVELFSVKESVYKAFFPRVGRRFGFKALQVAPSGERLTCRFRYPIDPAYPPERSFPVGRDWRENEVLTGVFLRRDESNRQSGGHRQWKETSAG